MTVETDFHRCWQCPASKLLPERRRADFLEALAPDGVKECPALWLRGLAPQPLFQGAQEVQRYIDVSAFTSPYSASGPPASSEEQKPQPATLDPEEPQEAEAVQRQGAAEEAQRRLGGTHVGCGP